MATPCASESLNQLENFSSRARIVVPDFRTRRPRTVRGARSKCRGARRVERRFGANGDVV